MNKKRFVWTLEVYNFSKLSKIKFSDSYWKLEKQRDGLKLLAQCLKNLILPGQVNSAIKGKRNQLKQRWKNILDPLIVKKGWEKQQEQLLFRLYDKIGPKWCQIVKQFPGRSYNNVKNYFYSSIRKVIRKINKIINERKQHDKQKIIKQNQLLAIFKLIDNQQSKQLSISKSFEEQCNDIRRFILYEMIIQDDASYQHSERILNIARKIHRCYKLTLQLKQKQDPQQIIYYQISNERILQDHLQSNSTNNIKQAISQEAFNVSPFRQQIQEWIDSL